jgi:hypothetical protein
MSNFVIFAVGLIITLIAGMGVITSQVFIGYKKFKLPEINTYTDTVIEPKG